MKSVGKAAVLGAGVMGSQIAAHLANAGVPTLLYDVSAEAARDGLQRARTLKPDPFFTTDTHALISTGSFDDLTAIAACDWIVEAVIESLDAKRTLLERVERHANPAAIVSSNTSGIPLAAIAADRSDAFKARWLGTHFFNPPRYLPLLEVIPTARTRQDVVEAISSFADHRLGKGVVVAKDSPGFIANRIGVYGVLRVFDALAAGGYTIEEVDAITGPAIGRPKSATFRTLDLAGLDILAHVVRGLAEGLPGERQAFAVPPLLDQLIGRGSTGAKSGSGFYRKDENGEIQVLDLGTLAYRPLTRPRFPALDAARGIDDVGKRLQALFAGSDRVGEFLRATLAPTLLYAATVAPHVAHSSADVDRAMRWGFGWELGPFEMLHAIGIEAVVKALKESAAAGDAAVLLSSAGAPGALVEPSQAAPQLLKRARAQNRIVRRNPGASLVDLGDGVLCVEFHSKMNAIGGDTIQMLQVGLQEASANFAALVVGNDAPHFTAGANLMLLLLEAQEGNWDEVDTMVRAFQQATMALKHAAVPVVVAPAGMALGGGCEIALHGDRVQAAAETYIGLVETGVGLIPAGGGTKEMLARAMDDLPPGSDLLPFVQRVFETIAFAKVSTSAADARRLGYLRDADGITMNRERLIADARALALSRVEGYVPQTPRTAIRVGGAGLLATLKLGVHLAWRAGRISDHDALIGRKLAWILAGGDAPTAGAVTEQQLLDLEREAFLSLCGERKTLERIAHTLKTGKPLRN
jgi:3-hydroxyacyl-CoA dehydrogenase